jgi:dihydrofolate reductase
VGGRRGRPRGQFADAGLLDEIVTSIAPVPLGSGRPLFPRRYALRLEELARNGAFACARFTVLEPRTADWTG